MSLEYLELLEERVEEMIDRVKSLGEKNASLERELIQQQKAFYQLEQERGEVRQRVERILGTLNDLAEVDEDTARERDGEPETSD